MKRVHSRRSWGSYRERNQKSPTVVTWGHYGGMSLRSAILEKLNSSIPSCASNFHHFAIPWAPRGSLTGGHVKVMLAYGHSLSLDHQGFRPFSPDHREAAGPVGPAVARVQVHCDHQTVPSRALTTASTAVMEVMIYTYMLLLRRALRWVTPLIWDEGPPIGLYRTAVVHLVRSVCVGNQGMVHVSRKRTLY